MMRRVLVICSLVMAPFAGGCSEDPSDAGAGEPYSIETNRSEATIAPSTSYTLTAYMIDQNLARIPKQLAASSAGPAVVVDSVKYITAVSETRIFLRGAAATTGTDITVTGEDLTRVVKIRVQ